MSDERIKPCPFCGGEAEIKWVPWTEIGKSSGAYVLNVNHSPQCFIRNADGLIDGRMTDSCKERIIATWNTRKPMERIVERLEKELELAEKEIKRCMTENPLQFERAEGYATGIDTAIEIVKGGGADE